MRFKLVESKELGLHPIIAYHGSKENFEEFDLDHLGDNISTDEFDINGIYFSPDFDFALAYAVCGGGSSWTDEDGVEHSMETAPGNGFVYKCELTPTNPLVVDNSDDYTEIIANQERLKGFDILLHTNIEYLTPEGDFVTDDGEEYIVLDPSIITILEKTEHTPAEGGYVKKNGEWVLGN